MPSFHLRTQATAVFISAFFLAPHSSPVTSFSIPSSLPLTSRLTAPSTTATICRLSGGNIEENSPSSPYRRSIFEAAIAATASLSFLCIPRAIADDNIGTSPDHPIAVIGAGGKVGNLCTKILAQKKKLYTRAITRSGKITLSNPSSYATYTPGDVTKYESILDAVNGTSGVIFAASASGKKKGGDPAHVDYLGVYNTAKACLECGVPKLVVVSAGSTTRPDFVGFKATNLFVKYVYGDKIMDYKAAGEAVMRDLYTTSSSSPPLSYAVIRPGGLSDKPSEGPSAVHVSQGDVLSSEVTREDVAEVTVATLLKGKATDFVTIEVNGAKGIIKVLDSLENPPDILVHAGSTTFDGLLDGLFSDAEMRDKYPQYMNDFRGDKIEDVDKLI